MESKTREWEEDLKSRERATDIRFRNLKKEQSKVREDCSHGQTTHREVLRQQENEYEDEVHPLTPGWGGMWDINISDLFCLNR